MLVQYNAGNFFCNYYDKNDKDHGVNTKVYVFMMLVMMQSLVCGTHNTQKRLQKGIAGAKMQICALQCSLITLKMQKKLSSCWIEQEEADRIENKINILKDAIASAKRSIAARRIVLKELENERRE